MESYQAQPSRTRHMVLVFAVTLAIITYIDRVCISQAAPNIQKDLGLDKIKMGWALSAFAWSYALFEIPGGWLGDWIGPRKVLTRVVIWWSFFTAATGWVRNIYQLVVVRFLFGAGEAGCFPNVTKIFSTWLPHPERTRAQGIMWMSARWGGAFTPMLVMWVLGYMDWRSAFMVFGALGIVWAIIFFIWFRDNPQHHPQVNEGEKELLKEASANAAGHPDVPWARVLKSPTVWLIWFQYFCLSYGWYFYITWLPTYLQEYRGVNVKASAIMAGMPLFFGGVGCMVAGIILPKLTRKLGVIKARRSMAFVGFAGAAAMLFLSLYLKNVMLAMVVISLASFANDLTMPGSWSTCMDVGGKYAGTLSGSMNMMGNLAGGVSPLVIGYIVQLTNQNWALTFMISSVIYVIGGLCWIFINPTYRVDQDPHPSDEASPSLAAGSK